jgi:hypothetical protein
VLKLYTYHTNIIKPLYTFFYLYIGELGDFLLFYPVGMLLTIYVLSAILYMLISASSILAYYINLFVYNLDISNLNLVFECISYMVKFWGILQSFIYDILFFFSKYILIFYFKRIEFYFFWFFVITLFINL